MTTEENYKIITTAVKNRLKLKYNESDLVCTITSTGCKYAIGYYLKTKLKDNKIDIDKDIKDIIDLGKALGIEVSYDGNYINVDGISRASGAKPLPVKIAFSILNICFDRFSKNNSIYITPKNYNNPSDYCRTIKFSLPQEEAKTKLAEFKQFLNENCGEFIHYINFVEESYKFSTLYVEIEVK